MANHDAAVADLRRSRFPLLISFVLIPLGVATIVSAPEVDQPEWWIVGIGVVLVWMGVGSAAAVLGDRVRFASNQLVVRQFVWFRFRTEVVAADDGCSMRVTSVRARPGPGVRVLEIRNPNGRRRLRMSLQWFSRFDRQRIVRRCERLCR